jgi:20S proteasome alpha/beta subunit
MTLIASVVAKKGVAIIADSLVTSMELVIGYNQFLNYFKRKTEEFPKNEIEIEPQEIISLFERKPSHTKDYEEKLFQFDKYTAVTTAGSAIINKKRIEYLIKEIVDANKKNRSYNKKRIETKIKDFCEYVNKKAIEHINSFGDIGNTTFIFTHYNTSKETTTIYKVKVASSSKSDIKDDNFNCVTFRQESADHKVVCDGQNRISERILFGEIDFFIDITPKIIKKVIADFKIPESSIPENYVSDFFKESKTLLPNEFYDDMKNSKLADLSLQQAVDLASLLMKIEINFQKYTENIPTVGGVVKLAVIDKDGFRFINGHEILKPENLH